jgi:hypothetical protein
MLKKAQPLPEFHSEMLMDELEIRIPIAFKLDNKG